MNWKWIALASAIAVLLWLLSAQWWHDIHSNIVLQLDEIIVTSDTPH